MKGMGHPWRLNPPLPVKKASIPPNPRPGRNRWVHGFGEEEIGPRWDFQIPRRPHHLPKVVIPPPLDSRTLLVWAHGSSPIQSGESAFPIDRTNGPRQRTQLHGENFPFASMIGNIAQLHLGCRRAIKIKRGGRTRMTARTQPPRHGSSGIFRFGATHRIGLLVNMLKSRNGCEPKAKRIL